MSIEDIAHQRVHYGALVHMYARACQLKELGYKTYSGKKITKRFLSIYLEEIHKQFPEGKPKF